MKSWVRHIGIVCAVAVAALWALPVPAAQVVRTMHPLPKFNKVQAPDPVVPPPAGQIRWKPDGSDRFKYMQAYRLAISSCVQQVFPRSDPDKGVSAAPDEEMTSDNQIRIAKCMAQTGMSAGPAIFLPSAKSTARYYKPAGNMTKHYIENTEAKAILNMTKKFDKIYAARKKAYMTRLAMANTARAKYISAPHVSQPAASGDEAPPIYLVPDSSANKTERPSTIQSPPEGQLWVTPQSQ